MAGSREGPGAEGSGASGRTRVGSELLVVWFGVFGVILRWLHGVSGVGLFLCGCAVTWV